MASGRSSSSRAAVHGCRLQLSSTKVLSLGDARLVIFSLLTHERWKGFMSLAELLLFDEKCRCTRTAWVIENFGVMNTCMPRPMPNGDDEVEAPCSIFWGNNNYAQA